MTPIDRTATSARPMPSLTKPSLHSRRTAAWHFARHYLEMVVAMLVGMAVLGFLPELAWPSLTARADVGVLVMVTDMAIGMGAWMRFRGHSWRGIAEMSGSMYAPFVALLVPYWTGSVGGHHLMTWGHVLMFPSMALAMYLRPTEYAH